MNKKNGTIHLKGLCDEHLPLLQTTVKNPISSHIHRSKQQQITKTVLGNLSDELGEELLIDAIKASPTSSHLYKYLIKQWGRRKEYTKIHDFLSINIKYIESKLTSSTREKERRKYLNAILELRTKKIVLSI